MNADTCKELAGWLGLVHPEILDEFQTAKKDDPYLSNIPPSQEYFDVKKIIDDLVNASKYEFTQTAYNPKYKYMIGYYYKEQLAFIYDCTCIEGGRTPHFSYWVDFFKESNSSKEMCWNDPNRKFAYTKNNIIKAVTKVLGQIADHEKWLTNRQSQAHAL